jgi:hypothetical protein
MAAADRPRIVQEEIAKCERLLGKPLSENDQVWIWQHVGRMLERRAERDAKRAEGEGQGEVRKL